MTIKYATVNSSSYTKESTMNTELEKLFKSYDFGYNLDLVSAEDWVCDANHYYRNIYLEDNSKNVAPIAASFHIYMHSDGSIRQLVVEIP